MRNRLYIVWNDNGKLGIPIIDEQHRGIVSAINSFYYFVQAGRGNRILKPTMIMLEQYTDIHFRTEESLMAEAGYPALKEHIMLHKELMKKTGELSNDANRNDDSDIVMQHLKEWWLGHINKEDRKYAPFLRKLMDTRAF